uniref:Zona pellucida glycoprotein 2, tandem duplicate 6 n=1 Tax=Sinocyclocheilus anshuiensis TaxID=1608454 RepID=A0A671T3A7_9TELE
HVKLILRINLLLYLVPVTVQCIRDGQFVVVVARDVTLGDWTVWFHHKGQLLFQCRYSGTSVEALVVEVNSVPPPPPVVAPGPLRVELRLASGQCVTKGCAEGKVLSCPVYVEVRIMERTDPNVVLMLGRCWATSTPSPLSLPQCPYQDDRYLTTLVPVTGSSGLLFPTHYKRFVVKMFTFVDPASLIFIHCSTSVCHSLSGSCERICSRKRRDVDVKAVSSEHTIVSMLPNPRLLPVVYVSRWKRPQ